MEATASSVPGPAQETAAAAELRLEWSRWTRCQSSFSLALAPHQPGLYALAEEVVPAGEAGSRRLLALFEIAQADDLARSLGQLFAASSPWREHLASGRCFVRYAVVAGRAERDAACAALQAWLVAASDVAAPATVAAADLPVPRAAVPAGKAQTAVERPSPLPAGF